MKKLQKQQRKTRRRQEWQFAQKKEHEKKSVDRQNGRRNMRRFQDEEEMDWRDILRDEGEDNLHGS